MPTITERRTLMGHENESSLSVVNRQSKHSKLFAEQVCEQFLDSIRRRVPYVPDQGHGFYISNGARIYPEVGGHPEWASPECSNPRDLAAYDQSCERLMLAGAQWLREDEGIEVDVTRHCIGVVTPNSITFSQHESYLSWTSRWFDFRQLLPHMVSRTIYAGAGCLSSDPNGCGFELSQRTRHLTKSVSDDTQSNRGIVCSRLRKATDRCPRGTWARLHQISKDSQRSPDAHYLTCGSTALVIHGLRIASFCKVIERLTIQDPVASIRDVSRNPLLQFKIPLKHGPSLTALEMQRILCDACARFVDRGDGPDWAPHLVNYWRTTLNLLDTNPLFLAPSHDAYLRWQIFNQQIRRAGATWRRVHLALRIVDQLRRAQPRHNLSKAIEAIERGKTLPDEMLVQLREAGFADQFDPLDLQLVMRLKAVDLDLHRIGGLYDQLRKAGTVSWSVIDENDVQRAMVEPPIDTRAAPRGQLIKQLANEPGWRCNWDGFYNDQTGSSHTLSDPFQLQAGPHGGTLTDESHLYDIPF
ncbi:MAG: proteasome accessory factor PafA2 family protein [Planctomycetaceae bacterium]|nr:proteasome accessory factor PafA2 family protein [Planctomycetaceae bacterium]